MDSDPGAESSFLPGDRSLLPALPGKPRPADAEGDDTGILHLCYVGCPPIGTAETDIARLPAQHIDLGEDFTLRGQLDNGSLP